MSAPTTNTAWLDGLRAPKPVCTCGHGHPVYLCSTQAGYAILDDCVFCACETYRPVAVKP